MDKCGERLEENREKTLLFTLHFQKEEIFSIELYEFKLFFLILRFRQRVTTEELE